MADGVASQPGSGGRGSGGRGKGRGDGRGRGRGGRGKGRGRGPNKDVAKDNKASGAGNDSKGNGASEASKNAASSSNQGGGGKNRRRNNKNMKNEKQPPQNQQKNKEGVVPQVTDDDKKLAEEERLKKEVEEAESKRIEKERKELQEKIEARNVVQQELNAKYQQALESLTEEIASVKSHQASRKALSADELNASRKAFEASKKTLKSDLKKCTTFVKKVKTGIAWSMRPSEVVRDVTTLNLGRFVEEIATAILEAKLKLTDIPVALALCKAMHERYSNFLSALLPGLWSVIHSKPTEETGKLRRVYVRLITEFLLNGLSSETKQLVKLITEVSGGKDGSYNVTDAHIVLAFVKAAGFEILNTTPTSIQTNMELIRSEIRRVEQAAESLDENLSDLCIPVVIQAEAAEKGTAVVNDMESLLLERAVSAEVAKVFYNHCKGAYATLCKSLVNTDSKLKKMEKRCDQDRLLAGTLTESREKGLQDARKLRETLWKSVEVMSDTLALPMPKLEESIDDEVEGGTGVEVWTKSGADEEGANFGPFDDEETRAFYRDIPDFLTTVPPALLGLGEGEIEKRKAENQRRFGSDFGEVAEEGEEVVESVEEIAPSSEEELDAAEKEVGSTATEEIGTNEENKDTPHYKLMVLLEQELPECNRREKVDELSEKFCTNHGSSKNSRKRLSQTLFHVPRTRLDLLPYYSRMATTLSRVWPEIGENLLKELEQQFHGQAKFKKNQNIESRLRTSRYIGELTKFRLAPPIVGLRCLHRCLDDFSGGNVDVSCSMLETCGRYLYRLPHTNDKVQNFMDTMIRLSKAKRLDERSLALIKTAMYTVKPPPGGPKRHAKVYSPLEGYLRHLLLVTLQPIESSISSVAKQILRFPWENPAMQCSALMCKVMLKACRVGRYESIHAVAKVAAKLRRHRPELCTRLLDTVVEELQSSMEHPAFKDQQRTLTVARLLGELNATSLASAPLIFQQLFLFINFGHEIPESLRKASHVATSPQHQTQVPVLNSASGISQPIAEDEEMEDSNLDTKEEECTPEPVAVSVHSTYDPRVTTSLDPPNSVFRIKLVCALLEVSTPALMTKGNQSKVGAFLTAFQRYLFTKSILPTEVEFALLDTFDIIDSEWRKITGVQAKGGTTGKVDALDGFPRFSSWREAHNATVAHEEAHAVLEMRARARLEAQAGNGEMADEINTVGSESSSDDEDGLDEDDDYDSTVEDAMSVDGRDSDAEDSEHVSGDEAIDIGNQDDHEGSQATGTVDGEESDDETDDSDEGSEDDFDEAAYMQQLEAEAFEAELRRLTMDALEKGKSTIRGGQVSDYMPTGSQFIKKKDVEASEPEGPTVALGGKEGISFSLLKKGNKGKMESKQFLVPKDTNLAAVASKQDHEAARERDVIKARVLQYEAESAESTGGNVYLEQEKLSVIRNRPLLMDEIDKNFGTSGGNLQKPPGRRAPGVPQPVGGRGTTYLDGARGRGPASGRGGGRGGRGRSGRGLV